MIIEKHVGLALSPDGNTLFTTDMMLRDAGSGQVIYDFLPLTGSVWAIHVAFSPDDKFVLISYEDQTVYLYDMDYHDTIHYACSLLVCDLTPDERNVYGINIMSRYACGGDPAVLPGGEEGQRMMRTAITQLNLSARAYHRILKLARTIAVLAV